MNREEQWTSAQVPCFSGGSLIIEDLRVPDHWEVSHSNGNAVRHLLWSRRAQRASLGATRVI